VISRRISVFIRQGAGPARFVALHPIMDIRQDGEGGTRGNGPVARFETLSPYEVAGLPGIELISLGQSNGHQITGDNPAVLKRGFEADLRRQFGQRHAPVPSGQKQVTG